MGRSWYHNARNPVQAVEYLRRVWGSAEYDAAMDEAGIELKLYLPVTDYPDEKARRLLDGVAAVTGADRERLLAGLGEQADHQVYAVLHAEDGDGVATEREDEDGVLLEYDADPERCALARGVLTGPADEHDVDVGVSENACMEHGVDACEMRVRRA